MHSLVHFEFTVIQTHSVTHVQLGADWLELKEMCGFQRLGSLGMRAPGQCPSWQERGVRNDQVRVEPWTGNNQAKEDAPVFEGDIGQTITQEFPGLLGFAL